MQTTRGSWTLIYISNNIAYKPRKDLSICKSCELELTFIEIIKKKKKKKKKYNVIFGVINKHPTMNLKEFNDRYANKLLDNISKENKTNKFLDFLSSNMILLYILHPNTVADHSKTTDNIFSNHVSK